ncbi:MAG: PEP-CTERM sorting domain-containing protein [Deltaproteobacteria bacterium]|nr:PEP-CTERM sorting domain-containing protein [Deltaproteobacteria bacterium]
MLQEFRKSTSCSGAFAPDDYHRTHSHGEAFLVRGEPIIPIVPEPSTLLLLGSGIIGLGCLVRKRMKK